MYFANTVSRISCMINSFANLLKIIHDDIAMNHVMIVNKNEL